MTSRDLVDLLDSLDLMTDEIRRAKYVLRDLLEYFKRPLVNNYPRTQDERDIVLGYGRAAAFVDILWDMLITLESNMPNSGAGIFKDMWKLVRDRGQLLKDGEAHDENRDGDI